MCLCLLHGCTSVVPNSVKESSFAEDTEESTPESETETTTAEPKDPLEEMIEGMTLEEKVCQMFIARCPAENQTEILEKYPLGGYILFGRDFEDKTEEDVKSQIESFQQASKIKMLIAVDEEGGSVVRVSRNENLRDTPFKSPSQIYGEGGLEAVAEDTEEKSRLLLSLGINTNFAPVCDVTTDEQAFMYDRTLRMGAEDTAKYVKTVVQTMKKEGIASVLKHFPGYGNNGDSHESIITDERPLSDFESTDFVPFLEGIANGADMVLVSHNIVTAVDGEFPASISEKVHELLRNYLGFDGVIVTDDLIMKGLTDYAGEQSAAVLAVKAGNDLLCSTDFETQIEEVLTAVKNGEIAEERIDESVYRILKLKQNIGILE